MSTQNTDDQNAYAEPTELDQDASYDESVDDLAYSEDDQNWEEGVDDVEFAEDESGDTLQQEQPQKKKSNKSTLIIIAVAVIGVFGFMLLKGGNQSSDVAGQNVGLTDVPQAPVVVPAESSNPPADSALNDLRDSTNAAQEQVAPAQAPVSAPQGLMDNPDLLAQPAPTSAPAPGQPTTAAPAVEITNTMTAPQADAPAAPTPATALTPDVKPVSDFPTVDAIKRPDAASPVDMAPVTTPTAAVVAEPAPVEPVVPTVKATDTAAADMAKLQQQLADATARISKLEGDIAEKETKLQEVQSKVAADDTSELKGKISKLEDQLAQQKAVSSKSEVTAAPTKHSVKSVVPAKKTVTTKSVADNSNWVLKSAKPGRAVIQDIVKGDYRTVVVGDTVPGVGKITAISETAKGWIVKGTLITVSE